MSKEFKRNILSAQLDLSKFEPASKEMKEQQALMKDSSTFFKDGVKRFKRNKVAVIALFVIAVIVFASFVVPIFYPYSYDGGRGGMDISDAHQMNKTSKNLDPFQYSLEEMAAKESGTNIFPHLFGTDSHGRDYFIRTLYGARISLLAGFFASIIVLIIGVIYGSISGYFGGKVDLVMMRIVDVIYSLPDLLIIILLSVVLDKTLGEAIAGTPLAKIGTGMISIFIVFGLLYWVGMARLIRGQILGLKEQEFVLAAKALGAKPSRIIKKHLLPNCISVIVISACLQIPAAIFTESFLSFLGLGVSKPIPSLGSLASEALLGIYTYPHRLIIPAIFICLIVLSLNLFGDGLRDAFDPKLTK